MIRATLMLLACLVLADRSHDWPAFERQLIEAHPYCAACGRRPPEVQLVGHHVLPFHDHPELELEADNVLVLCDVFGKKADRKACCHWIVGHGAKSWRAANPYAREQAKALLRRNAGAISQRHKDTEGSASSSAIPFLSPSVAP